MQFSDDGVRPTIKKITTQLHSTEKCFTNMDIQHWLIAIWGWLPHRFICSIVTGFRKWWRHQMETFSALLALLCGNSPHKGHWTMVFSLICAWINRGVNNRETGDLRSHRADYDAIVIFLRFFHPCVWHQIVSTCVRTLTTVNNFALHTLLENKSPLLTWNT